MECLDIIFVFLWSYYFNCGAKGDWNWNYFIAYVLLCLNPEVTMVGRAFRAWQLSLGLAVSHVWVGESRVVLSVVVFEIGNIYI